MSPTASLTAQPTTWSSSFYGTVQCSPFVSSFPGPYQPPLSSLAASSGSQKEQSYPQRPGQPECQYYMNTGDCKFGSSCRYHHPIDPTLQETSIIISPMGLPLRPVRFHHKIISIHLWLSHGGLWALLWLEFYSGLLIRFFLFFHPFKNKLMNATIYLPVFSFLLLQSLIVGSIWKIRF